jgi:isopentenyl diphosphate isomerase/L-lactate dehydrogenase-like FMN-dependent dehydrogenase
MEIKTIRDKARELTRGVCRVCPVCDGRVCSGEVPGMGGTGTGAAFRGNIAALNAIRLRTRLVHSVHNPGLETNILGLKLSMPLMIGPIGGIAFNLGNAMPEQEYQSAIVDGAVAAGIIAGIPDGAPIEIIRTGLTCAARHNGRAIPFFKPWAAEEFEMKVTMGQDAGCGIVGSDLDGIGMITLRRMGRHVYAKNPAELAEMADIAHRHDARMIIKGIMSVEDAVACVEAGMDGIIVSNHGGRVLDHTPGTAEVLPPIAAAVKGRIALIADGGVRTGVDALKMLALGADCVMIGRPYAIAAIGGGKEGVELYTRAYRDQLEQAMIMTGCADVAQAGRHLIHGG